MKALVFDIECQNHREYKRLAAPFCKENYIVEIGYCFNGGEVQSERFEKNHREHVMVDALNSLEKGDILVGFNTKFDLLWLWHQESLQAALKRGVTIYCGQYMEYLLGGMTPDVQMANMNDTAAKYGGGDKLDSVKEMWEEGYLTSEIPADLLHDYLCGDGNIIGDVHNTWLIMQGQIRRIREEGYPKEFRTMFKHRMDGLLATTEMEYNGMYVNRELGDILQIEVATELEAAKETLEAFIPELPNGMEFNWNSNVHKSCLMFGGVAKYEKWAAHSPLEYTQKTEKWPLFDGEPVNPKLCKLAGSVYVLDVTEEYDDEYSRVVQKGDKFYAVQDTFSGGQKKGQPKTKNVKVDDLTKPKGKIQPFYFKFDGYTKPLAKWRGALTDAYDQPIYGTGADVIEELSKRGVPFTDALATHTSKSKDLGTYYWAEDKKGKRKGMLTLVNDGGIIHHSLHHVKTVTSRMSSSDPNLQNIPRGDTSKIKQVFTSRFTDGRMAEIDYSQLEVVVQGVLSKDKQLTQDLLDKTDFHCKRLAAKLDRPYEEIWSLHHEQHCPDIGKQRTDAKNFSFQRAYGAGVAAIVESTGMSKEDVESLVAAEEVLYPGISKFDRDLEKRILRNRKPTDRKIFLDGTAFTQGEGHWDSPTGTRYVWRENVTPAFMHKSGKYTGFSPTERKNYPVQGFGGEIVQTMLGKVFRYFLENDRFDGKVLLVNTVHDCLLLDGETEADIQPVALEVQRILESVPEVFNKAFPDTLDIIVPFPCETEIGKDLFDMSVYHG